MSATAIQFPSLLEVEPRTRESGGGEGLIQGADGRLRPAWVGEDPVLEDYYDNEWGRPLTDPQQLFELQSLLVFQAGLRWRSILLRRPRLRAALQGFSVGYLSLLDDKDIDRLAEDERMIRNRAKIRAVVTNARAVRELGNSAEDFAELIWSFQPETTPCPRTTDDLPASIPEADALAKALKERGFSFVGAKSCFALMQSAGIVDANPLGTANRGISGLWDEDGRRVRRPNLPGMNRRFETRGAGL